MRQPRQRTVRDHGQVFELKAAARLPGKRSHDAELEMTHPGFALQRGIDRRRQERERGHQMKPCAPLAVVQPPERLWRLGGIRLRNKLTLQALLGYQLEASTSRYSHQGGDPMKLA